MVKSSLRHTCNKGGNSTLCSTSQVEKELGVGKNIFYLLLDEKNYMYLKGLATNSPLGLLLRGKVGSKGNKKTLFSVQYFGDFFFNFSKHSLMIQYVK